MQVYIRTGRNIAGHEALAAQVRGVVESTLSRFNDRITRVEAHLSDENSHKRGHNDKRCTMEARFEGRQPIAVTHQAATLSQSVSGAVDKLAKLIENTLGRLRDQRRRMANSFPGPQRSHLPLRDGGDPC